MRYFLTAMLVFLAWTTEAQTRQLLGSTNTDLVVQSLMSFDSAKSVLNLKLYDTATTKLIYPGRLPYRLARESDGRLYQYIGSGFQLFDNVTGGGGGGSTDTTSLSNRINQKVSYMDTAAMLLPYATKANLKDTAILLRSLISSSGSTVDTTSLSNRIDHKVGYSDTLAMLASYLRDVFIKSGTDSLFKVKGGISFFVTRVNSIDTSSLSNRINTRQGYPDTTTWDATKANLRDTSSLLRTLIAAKQNTLTLTTTGTSGVATLIGATLNIPNYTSTGADSAVFVTNYKLDTAKSNLRASINAKWGITGNAGTTPGANYIGTSDAQNLSIRANGLERVAVRTDARVNIASRLGTIGDSSLIFERNGGTISEFNTSGGIRMGLSTSLPASGIAIGQNSINIGFLGMALQGGYNEGAKSMAIGFGSISAGPQNIVIGKQAYAGTGGNSIALGTANRSNHMGVFISGDGTYDPSYFTSRKDFEFITHFTTGYHFQTNVIGAPKYVDIDSSGNVDAVIHTSHSAKPTATVGAGAGSTGSVTIVRGNLNNYQVSVTVAGTTATGTIFTSTIDGFTFSEAMAPTFSPANAAAAGLSGTQQISLDGTTRTHVMASGSVALLAGTYIWNVSCTPKK